MSAVTVERIRTEHGSRIEPPLGEDWPELEKLRWHAAVVELDAGLPPGSLRINPDALQERVVERKWLRRREGWVPVPGYYSIGYLSASAAAYTFHQMWALLNGVSIGAEVAQDVARR